MYNQNYVDNESVNNLMDEGSFGFNDIDEFCNNDSFLGIGKRNKQKKAERKIAKSAKQLERGHVKAAKRKLDKGRRILSNIQKQQSGIMSAQQQQKDINATNAVINASNVAQTESLLTAPTQLGSESGATTMSSGQAALQSMGGGAGDMGGDYSQDISSTEIDNNPLSTTEENAITLKGVTVGNKPKWILYVVIGLVLLGVIYFIVKKSKSQTK